MRKVGMTRCLMLVGAFVVMLVSAMAVLAADERPLVIGSLYTYEVNDKVHTKHEFHSLSPGALSASFDGTTAWTPKQAGLQWRDFADGPEPKGTHSNRALQMRQLSRPFRAELINPNGEKTELRLAPRPLFEYSSPKAGVIDGAIFSFVVATDPEVLLVIEAFEENRDGKQTTGFRHAFARFHYWNVIAYDGNRRVWEAPLDKSHETNQIGDREQISKTYISFHPRCESVAIEQTAAEPQPRGRNRTTDGTDDTDGTDMPHLLQFICSCHPPQSFCLYQSNHHRSA